MIHGGARVQEYLPQKDQETSSHDDNLKSFYIHTILN